MWRRREFSALARDGSGGEKGRLRVNLIQPPESTAFAIIIIPLILFNCFHLTTTKLVIFLKEFH